MKRDMDLIRKMLLTLEASETGRLDHQLSIDGYEQDIVDYHAYLLNGSGLCEGVDMSKFGSDPRGRIIRLTWAGHEFLDVARDETRWRKAMAITAKSAGTVTIAILTQLLSSLMKQSLNIN